MSTAAQKGVEPRLRSVDVTDDGITAHFEDGRVVTVPLSWSWRLERATVAQRKNYQIIGNGEGAHWPAPRSCGAKHRAPRSIRHSPPRRSPESGRLFFIALVDSDVFLQQHRQRIGSRIVSDLHPSTLQYLAILLVRYTVMISAG